MNVLHEPEGAEKSQNYDYTQINSVYLLLFVLECRQQNGWGFITNYNYWFWPFCNSKGDALIVYINLYVWHSLGGAMVAHVSNDGYFRQ